MTESIEQAVTRLVSGDRSAFGELYEAYVKRIYDFVFYRVSDKEVAEDIVSESFFKALRSIESFHGKTEKEFSSWLYTIAYRMVVDKYRSSDGESVDIDVIAETHGITEDFADKVDNSATLENVLSFLDTLPKTHKDILLMAIWDDLPYDQIAEIMKISEANCRQIVSRTLRKIEANVAYLFIFALLLQLQR